MSRFNMRRLAVAITVASAMVGGMIATSGCVATGGTSCGQGCCARDVDCRGGKACHYGQCLCPTRWSIAGQVHAWLGRARRAATALRTAWRLMSIAAAGYVHPAWRGDFVALTEIV